MAAREFRGTILNNWRHPLICRSHYGVNPGEWQSPWEPYDAARAGQINPGEKKEWRSDTGPTNR